MYAAEFGGWGMEKGLNVKRAKLFWLFSPLLDSHDGSDPSAIQFGVAYSFSMN